MALMFTFKMLIYIIIQRHQQRMNVVKSSRAENSRDERNYLRDQFIEEKFMETVATRESYFRSASFASLRSYYSHDSSVLL
jgi:hypothetical protein